MNDNPYTSPLCGPERSTRKPSRVRGPCWLGFLRGVCVGVGIAIVLQLIRLFAQ